MEDKMEKSTRLRKAKISRVSIVDQVCASIKQDIADGIWNPGDKLHSEAEFAESFGVNRLSVRMALQKLSTLGIIETRVGEGSFVRPFSLKPLLTEISVFYEGDEKYKEIQQLRNLLEGACMELAVQNATPEDLEGLHAALVDYNAVSAVYYEDPDNKEVLDEVVEADFAFHYKVVKMSHNSLYKDVYFMVQQLIRRHIAQLLSNRVKRRRQAGLPTPGESDTHNKIYNCILTKDREALARAGEEMLGIVPVKDFDVFD